ncbi:uncharacterized protein LOC128718175 [Anopheles marshallii]|uniref:uncharacterized protein LOC128718175 n=1 Tax=Anopheles marshallii TaxID=1521116 RepID=UPI00237C0C59|nr:uncharacterized protein LOC128718175 [Anopheles marshallii]
MTGNTGNLFELLIQQLHKEQYCTNKLPVRKIYIDEDPAKEQVVPCPRCSDRNQQNMVRYLFVNLSEAIYKCEAYDCMYPFRNFKFKNFEESTVYRYELQPQHDFASDYVNNLSNSCNTFDNTIDHIGAVDFNMDFLSGEGVADVKQQPATTQTFSHAAHCHNALTNFDTGFIDEILEDLFPTSSNPISDMKKEQEPEGVSVDATSASTTEVNSSYNPATQCSSVRKLEKCLKVFEKPQKISEDDVFKKPKAPKNVNLVVEHITPTKLRIKRVAQAKSKVHIMGSDKRRDRTAQPFSLDIVSNGTLKLKEARALVKKKKLKPLDLLCKLKTLTEQIPSDSSPVLCQPIRRKSPSSAKVQKMLNFIQRSMKTEADSETLRSAETVPDVEKNYCNRNSHSIMKSLPPVPSLAPLNAETYVTNLDSVEQLANVPAITIENYSAQIPKTTTFGATDMLIHFID